MRRGDRGLQLAGAGPPRDKRLSHQRHALADHPGVPPQRLNAAPPHRRLDLHHLDRVGDVLGTRGRMKVAGIVDDAPIRTSFRPLGDGRHKLPVTGKTMTTIGTTRDDTVTVHLTERVA